MTDRQLFRLRLRNEMIGNSGGHNMKVIGAALAAMFLVPMGMIYGIFVLPWIKFREEWDREEYGSALTYLALGGWPMWTILLIVIL